MELKFIEVTQSSKFNWGKFLLLRFDLEYEYKSLVGGYPLLESRGWDRDHLIVFDLETCEGIAVRPGGYAKADLDKHNVWICPMYEPFLKWLYQQDLTDLSKLPSLVTLADENAPAAMSGYRRGLAGTRRD